MRMFEGLTGTMKNVRKQNRRRPESPGESEWRKESLLTMLPRRDDSEMGGLRKKALYCLVLIILFFAVIVTRLWFLQVQQGDYYNELADSNRVRYQEIAAPRGNIYDRRGREIVTNRPSFNVIWTRENNKIDDDWLKSLSRILGQEPSILLEKIRKMVGVPGHIPVRLAEDIGWDMVARVENNRMHLPEVKIEVVPLRVYHHGNMASHLIGYLGEISKTELDQADKELYRGGDLIGKMGLERLREKELRGEKGREYMEVNALGFEQRNLKGIEPMPGRDLHLTLDIDLQKIAEEEMAKDNRAGGVVAIEANTGRLLVLASAPMLNLEDFVGGISQKAWQAMLDNPLHPLVNKVVQGQYPPGSTYKAVTAFAGLAEGLVNQDTSVFCPGFYRFGNRVYRCWKKGGHGTVSFKRAVAESCDVYFYQLGLRLGVDRLARYARMFGLGELTGVEMEHEKPGLIPTTTWKKSKRGQPWQEGETLSIAIGQGYDLATPLQIAVMTSVIANGGTLYKPSVVDKALGPDGQVAQAFTPEVLKRINGQGRNFKLVREGMVEAVNSRRGTGREAQIDAHGIIVGGKTGTAQVVRLAQYKHLKEKDIPYEYRDHAWFTCFAPASNPEIVVTVLVEHGLHGGSASAPIAAKILNRYFEDKFGEQAKADKSVATEARKPAKVVLSEEMLEETDAADEEIVEENGDAPSKPEEYPH